MMLSEVRIGDGLRDDGVSFMKIPPVEFCAPVSRDPVPGRRLLRGSAFEYLSRLAIFSVVPVLAVGIWACSSKPHMEGAIVAPNSGVIVRGPTSVSPTATPTAAATN